MSKIVLNKKKGKINLFLKRFLIVIILLLIIIFFFWKTSIHFKIDILSNYIETFSKKYNYLFTEIEIKGLNNITEDKINYYFEQYYNKSIFLVPIKQISQKIEKNNWVELVTLKNNFNNKISINIKEFDPIAVFFNGNNYLFISKSGHAIDFANDKEIQKYIILEGQNANKQASELLEAIPNKLKPNIVKAQYINNRRWDIYTKANLRIQLPEIEYKKAINIFIDIYEDMYSSDIMNIEYIDLRLSEKAIIKFYNEND